MRLDCCTVYFHRSIQLQKFKAGEPIGLLCVPPADQNCLFGQTDNAVYRGKKVIFMTVAGILRQT